MKTEHPPLKLSVDGKTGEPLTYNDGHELKIAPIDRNSPLYVNVGGTGKEQFAARIVLCVNSHDALLAACKAALEDFQSGKANVSTYDLLFAAIRKATP